MLNAALGTVRERAELLFVLLVVVVVVSLRLRRATNCYNISISRFNISLSLSLNFDFSLNIKPNLSSPNLNNSAPSNANNNAFGKKLLEMARVLCKCKLVQFT